MGVSVAAQNGFTGAVSVTVNGIPSGVTVTPAPLSVMAGSPKNLTFAASGAAVAGQATVTVAATSGSLEVDTPVTLTVSAAPIPASFLSVGGQLVYGFYDQTRQLLFATNPALNEVDVISGPNLTLVARVPVPSAWGIDQMADGNTLVVGTEAQEIFTLNEDTYATTRYVAPSFGEYSNAPDTFLPNPVAMANGKVLLIGQEQGVEGGNEFLIEWDSIANSFTQIEPTEPFQVNWFGVNSLVRSADHKWAVYSSAYLYLYSSDSDSFASVTAPSLGLPNSTNSFLSLAVNSDGSKIALVSPGSVNFLNNSLQILGNATIPGGFNFGTGGTAQFSTDGSRLFLLNQSDPAVEVFDVNSLTALGYYSGGTSMAGFSFTLLGIDSSGRAYFGMSFGVRETDTTTPPIPNSSGNLAGASCSVPEPNYVALNTTAQVPFLNSWIAPAGTTVYLGGKAATLLADGSDGSEIEIPASAIAGPVDVECIDSSGNTYVSPLGFSYGTDPIAVSANLVPPIGNPNVYLFGFGISDLSSTMSPTVTIGGSPALGVSSPPSDDGIPQYAVVQVPSGTPGEQADIQVTSINGEGTLSGAVTYIPSATIVPAQESQLNQLLYDTHRNLIYALNGIEVRVLDPTTLQWLAPIQLPTTLFAGFDAITSTDMALSPDGSKMVLVVSNSVNRTGAIVFDPDNPGQASIVTWPEPLGYGAASVAISASNKALVEYAGVFNIVDLSTLSVTRLDLSYIPSFVKASADGSHIYGVAVDSSNGLVVSFDPSSFSAQYQNFGELFWSDLAISSDGSQLAAICSNFCGIDIVIEGDQIGFFDSGLHYLGANAYPLVSPPDDLEVIGPSFSPQGKVLMVALGDSIEFWDTAQGTLLARLMTPEELNVQEQSSGEELASESPQVAVDPTGQIIYAISKSGLTVLKLPVPMDQMTAQHWPLAVRSGKGQSGFQGSIAARLAARHDSGKKRVRSGERPVMQPAH
jgi:hypothetical protein